MIQMKKYLLIFALALMACVSCNKPDLPEPEPQLVVNFTNTKGVWKLSQWKGEALPTGTFLYLKLDQKDKTFIIYDNLASIYGVKLTGRYNLVEDYVFGQVLTGEYDYTFEYWSHDYAVTSLTATRMELTAIDDKTEVSLYERVDEIPGLE